MFPYSEPVALSEGALQRPKGLSYPFLLKAAPSHSGRGVFFVNDGFKLHYLTFRRRTSRYLGGQFKEFSSWVATEYVNGFSGEFGGYVNAAVYLFNGRVVFADPRLSHKSFNIHAANSLNSLARLPKDTLANLCCKVLSLVKRDKLGIEESVSFLSFPFLRLDCVVDIASERIVIVEAEIKGGPGMLLHAETVPMLAKAGWPIDRIQDYLCVSSFSPLDLCVR